MTNALFSVPKPYNEPVRDYAPGHPDRKAIEAELARQYAEKIEIPLIIGGQEIRTGNLEPDGIPSSGGLRFCRHPLQLHRHCRQPAHGPGHDG
jgi:1-pyrroline-5-carboxylate dehydrogenase